MLERLFFFILKILVSQQHHRRIFAAWNHLLDNAEVFLEEFTRTEVIYRFSMLVIECITPLIFCL